MLLFSDFQIGRVEQKVLIAFLAIPVEATFQILSGALFHILVASPMKVLGVLGMMKS